MPKEAKFKQAWERISNNKTILITASPKASIDEICTCLSLQKIIQSTDSGKKVSVVINQRQIYNLAFLPGFSDIKKQIPQNSNGKFVITIDTENNPIEHVKYTKEENQLRIVITPKVAPMLLQNFNLKQEKDSSFDLLIAVGFSEKEELEKSCGVEISREKIINVNIDENIDFGDINLSDSEEYSTAKLTFHWLQTVLGEAKLRPIANYLLTGLVSASEGFLSRKCTAKDFFVSETLLSLGANYDDIIEHLFQQKSLKTLKNWGTILQNFYTEPDKKLTWTSIKSHDLVVSEKEKMPIINEVVNNFLRFVEQTNFAIVLLENKGGVMVFLRSQYQDKIRELQNIFPGKITKINQNYAVENVPYGLNFFLPGNNLYQAQTIIYQLLTTSEKNNLNEEKISVPFSLG